MLWYETMVLHGYIQLDIITKVGFSNAAIPFSEITPNVLWMLWHLYSNVESLPKKLFESHGGDHR